MRLDAEGRVLFAMEDTVFAVKNPGSGSEDYRFCTGASIRVKPNRRRRRTPGRKFLPPLKRPRRNNCVAARKGAFYDRTESGQHLPESCHPAGRFSSKTSLPARIFPLERIPITTTPEGAENFEAHVTHHYEFLGDKLIIGKFCAIARGIEFIMNGANHRMHSVTTYPFNIMGGGWEGFHAQSF